MTPNLRKFGGVGRSRRGAWWEAARPHTLPAAVAPVLVGGGLAMGDGAFRWDALVAALVGAIAIQVAANFANDVSDAHRGADTADRVGPPRMVAAGWIAPAQMWRATWLAVGVAALAGLYLTTLAGWVVVTIGFASILAMLGYVGGPLPYGYRGLGEVSVFLFFGMAATVGSRFVHDRSAPLDTWLLAIPVGLLAAAILVANNLRDIDTDTRAGKRTLAVIVGRTRTRRLYAATVWGAFAAIAAFAALGLTPGPTALACGWAFLAWPVTTTAFALEGPSLVGLLKDTARLHLLVGLTLAIGAAL